MIIYVNPILDRLKIAYKLKSDRQLANQLNFTSSTISTWRKRNIIDFNRLLAECDYIDLNWLIRGEGPMFLKEEAENKGPNRVNERKEVYGKKKEKQDELALIQWKLKKISEILALDEIQEGK